MKIRFRGRFDSPSRSGSALPALLLLLVLLLLAGAGCAPNTRSSLVHVAGTGRVSALAPSQAGGFRYGELETGKIMEVTSRGRVEPEPIATLDVAPGTGGGLVGLAYAPGGRFYASWVERSNKRLTVAEVRPNKSIRKVWVGPAGSQLATAKIATSGRIAFNEGGDLIIGIGSLQAPSKIGDPDAVNGQLLSLDVDGPEDQVPREIASGLNSPFAFAITRSGTPWVADSSINDATLRGRSLTFNLPRGTMPSGIAAVSDDLLLLCGFQSGVVQKYRIVDDKIVKEGAPLAKDCRYGLTILSDGRVLYAAENDVRVVRI